MRQHVTITCAAVVVFLGTAAFAQTPPGKMGRVGCPHCINDGSAISRSLQKADELHAALKPKEALVELLKVLDRDAHNAEALSKIARVYIDFGDMIPEATPEWEAKRLKQYQTAEQYARRAVKANPNLDWGYFYVAASLGSIAAVSPVAKQIDLAGEIRGFFEKDMEIDPQKGFTYHLYGLWHRKMAEIGKMQRVLASVFIGRSPPHGSVEKSIEYLKKAVSLNPTVIVSRLELARSYITVENWSSARNLLVSIRDLPIQFSDDPNHKQKAEQLIEEIKER
jgi:tetratricopeptide (TPR) repeat protein